MKYIAHKRFKRKCLCGEVNIPATTLLWCNAGLLFYSGLPVCFATSEVAHQYFAVNDDGKGMERGKLTQAIQKTLAKRDSGYQKRWDKIWSDAVCQLYKRKEYSDYWLWNHDFFIADIETLEYIAILVNAKEVD